MGAPPNVQRRTVEKSKSAKSLPAAWQARKGARYATVGPKKVVIDSCAIISSEAMGWYSRCRTTVPPMKSTGSVQTLSGAECQMGIATRMRSSLS